MIRQVQGLHKAKYSLWYGNAKKDMIDMKENRRLAEIARKRIEEQRRLEAERQKKIIEERRRQEAERARRAAEEERKIIEERQR